MALIEKREKLKRFAMKHAVLLKVYQNTFGKIKTKLFFDYQKKQLQKNGLQLIKEIDEVLLKYGQVCFVDCGTLLGLVRDQHLIIHDRDIDFGIVFNDCFTYDDLERVMTELGFKKNREFVFREEPREISYKKGVLGVDFFVHNNEDNHSIIYSFLRKADTNYPDSTMYTVRELKRAQIEALDRIEVGDLTVNIPANYEEYLESAYTENWRTPDPTWDSADEPGLTEIEGEYAYRR